MCVLNNNFIQPSLSAFNLIYDKGKKGAHDACARALPGQLCAACLFSAWKEREHWKWFYVPPNGLHYVAMGEARRLWAEIEIHNYFYFVRTFNNLTVIQYSTAITIDCCQKVRSVFWVLGIYNFAVAFKIGVILLAYIHAFFLQNILCWWQFAKVKFQSKVGH